MKKKKRGWLFRLMFCFASVLLVWLLAFLGWFFWSDLESFVKAGGQKAAQEQPSKPSQERIFEEERKKLEEVLKQRQ